MPLPNIPGVDASLGRIEDEVRRLGTSSVLPAINDAARPIVSSGGKRLRSVLTVSTVVALGGAVTDQVITTAACIELVHAGSLVHDDLMDNAIERRGVRTVNAEWGHGTALMIGDFIFARASQVALTSVSQVVAQELAAAVVELTEGQFLEMEDVFNVDRTTESALRSISLKTGALFRCCCVMAAHCTDASDADVKSMAEFGARFGIAFQVLDDLLDLMSTTEILGKPVGNDIRQGVYTVPLLRALQHDGLDSVRRLLAERGRELTDADIELILAELRASSLVEDTLEYCRQLCVEAGELLPPIADPEVAAALRRLPLDYLDWANSLLAREQDSVNALPGIAPVG